MRIQKAIKSLSKRIQQEKSHIFTTPLLKSLDFVADAQKINNKSPFDDVPAKSKYRSHIDNLHALNIMGAKTDNLFNPMDTMTQGEFADMLLLAHGWNGFPDESKEAREK